MLTAILVMALGAIVLGAALGFAAVRFKVEGDPLVEKIDAILPQTQCGQCGYPGCKPYAEAVAKGEADINCCPPGGEEGIRKLADLLGREYKELSGEHGVEKPKSVALIDEQICIGCHRRRRQADAHDHRRAVHGLRTVPAALPRQLHLDGTPAGNHRHLEMEISGDSRQGGAACLNCSASPAASSLRRTSRNPRLRPSSPHHCPNAWSCPSARAPRDRQPSRSVPASRCSRAR
jgi:Na+-translocating ferredoxin:NAD+ oxidoreductase RNF subunit RnfB